LIVKAGQMPGFNCYTMTAGRKFPSFRAIFLRMEALSKRKQPQEAPEAKKMAASGCRRGL